MMSNMIQNQSMLPPLMKIEEDESMLKLKQGIVTILTPSSASSLRRTLSADMSSKKWMHDLQQQEEEEKDNQDSFKMKKTASSEELTQHLPNNSYSSSSSDEGEEEEEEAERERLAIWSSILKNKKEEQEKSKAGFDTWGSIMSMKSDSDSNSNSNNKNNQSLEVTKSLPVSVTVTPYVHPLVKRSKSSLSDKSLEICTESLGSETGSDSLLFSSSSSSSSPSFPSGELEKVVKESEQEQEQEENIHAAAITKSKLLSHPRCFPPPLPSLSFRGCNNNKEDSSSSSSSLHMKPHRDNGRLVLQAVSLPSNNNFNAQRQDGRLVLTFANDQEVPEVEEEENYDDEDMEEEEEFEEEEQEEAEEEDDDEEEKEEEEEVSEVVMEKKAPVMSSGITTTTTTTVNSGGGNLHRLTLMMNNNNNKTIGLVNRNMNPNWSDKFNKKGMNMNLEDVNVSVVARLIPSSPGSATSPPPPSSFNLNAYEYFWKTPKPSSKLPNNNNNEQHQQLLVLRGKNGDYLVHNFKGCKDSRRSLLFWEPYCIATS